MKQMRAMLMGLITFSFLIDRSCGSSLSQLKNDMEQKVSRIADSILEQYQKKCDDRVTNCLSKSYNMCNGTGQRECDTNFPPSSSCLSNGLMVSTMSGVRLPNYVNLENLSEEQKLFICSTAFAQPNFTATSAENRNTYSFVYVGSSTGVFRAHPGVMAEKASSGHCVDYDPRRRPWYVSGITGPKNTIVMLDTSKTMKNFQGSRLRNALVTIEIIFESFNKYDNIGMINFAESAKIMGGFDHIVSASDTNLEKIINEMKDIETAAGTNYTAAFEKAFSMLGTERDMYTGCKEIIFLMLTDGSLSQLETYDELVQLIDGKMKTNLPNHSLKMISFVYGKQDNINYTLIKQLTCRYSGIVFRFEENIDEATMVQKLTNYYLFLSQGITMDRPIWSQPYVDNFGFGRILTVCKPIYSTDSNGIQRVVGVVGMDVLFSQLLEYEKNETVIENYLQDEAKCFVSNLTEEQLESLRCQQQQNICLATTICSSAKSSTVSCPKKVVSNIFISNAADTNTHYDVDYCCGLTKIQFAIIMISVGCALIAACIITACLYWKKKLCFKKYKQPPKTLYALETENCLVESEKSKKFAEGTSLQDPDGRYESAIKNNIKIYNESFDI